MGNHDSYSDFSYSDDNLIRRRFCNELQFSLHNTQNILCQRRKRFVSFPKLRDTIPPLRGLLSAVVRGSKR